MNIRRFTYDADNDYLNGTKISPEIEPDTLLGLIWCRSQVVTVSRGCETANCGLCKNRFGGMKTSAS